MPTPSRLDPVVATMLAAARFAGQPPLWSLSVDEARTAYRKASRVFDLFAARVKRVDDETMRTRDGADIALRLYAASTGRSLPALIWFHGGGFTIGGLDTHDALCRKLADAADCIVVSVDYRLAPEHRFPTAVHDACDAFDHVVAQAGRLGIDATRLAIGGDSAGGTLAAVLAVHARDRGDACVLQLLLYPSTGIDHDTPAQRRLGDRYLLDVPTLAWFRDHYVPDEALRRDWRLAPLDGVTDDGCPVDLRGVAPACVVTAGCDPLHDEGVAYADRLVAAGVPMTRLDYPGLVHGFIQFAGALPTGRIAQRDVVAALRDAFATAASSEDTP